MDDFERLFALAALVSDPATATENAKAMQEVKKGKDENTKSFKEIKAQQIALNKGRQDLESGWKSVGEAKKALKLAEADLEKERREVRDMRASAMAEVKAAQQKIDALEGDYKKRESVLKSELGIIEKAITGAENRKRKAEEDLDMIRKAVNA